jgi:hypothetical protein
MPVSGTSRLRGPATRLGGLPAWLLADEFTGGFRLGGVRRVIAIHAGIVANAALFLGQQVAEPDASLRRPYWITSSARSSSECGIVSPRALAALRLINSSNLVGCSTGRSAGLEPLRILST